MDGAFRAAEAHGIRAILGKVMMDRITYDETIDPSTILERSVRESAELIAEWHGADDGRLGYAVTPRFAVSCTAEMLRESAALAARTGAWWQTHVSEDPGEIAEVARLFPEAAGLRRRLRPRRRPRRRGRSSPTPSTSRIASWRGSSRPTRASPTARPRTCSWRPGSCPSPATCEAGLKVGLGSDVAGGPEASIFSVMRVGSYAQAALRTVGGEASASRSGRSTGCAWARSMARGRSASRTGSARSRRARRRTSSRSTRG